LGWWSSRAPGNCFAEAQKGQREDKNRDYHQTDHFTAFAPKIAPPQFKLAFVRTNRTCAAALQYHTTILRERHTSAANQPAEKLALK
jgi:galactose-1-phosphate uridylyltransferase